MHTVKIFLASSAELDIDKEQVELFFSRKNKDYRKKRVFVELSTWKDFLSAMTEEHSQEKYNEYIRSCDIAIFLFHSVLGRYTKEEFDNAHQAFISSTAHPKKPLIYTFFKEDKNEPFEISTIKEYIDGLGHFFDTYKSPEDLFVKLNRQLEQLEGVIIPAIRIDVPAIVKYAVYYFLLPLLVISGATLSYYYFQPLDMTVKIGELNQIPGLPFKDGNISLTYGDKTDNLSIKDEVIFKQIPSKYKHGQVELHFSSKGYLPIDTLVRVSDLIILPITRDNSLGVVFGWVRDAMTNLPLNGVTIDVKGIKVLTDNQGRFKIIIPKEQQEESVRLTARKLGYQLFDWIGYPSLTAEWQILLKK